MTAGSGRRRLPRASASWPLLGLAMVVGLGALATIAPGAVERRARRDPADRQSVAPDALAVARDGSPGALAVRVLGRWRGVSRTAAARYLRDPSVRPAGLLHGSRRLDEHDRWPGEVDLSWNAGGSYTYPDGIGFHDGISIFRRPVAISPSTGSPVPKIGSTAADLTQWLASHPDIVTSGRAAVTVGGAPGYRISIALPKSPRSGPDTCTDHGVPACESLFQSDAPGGFGIVGPESVVIYLLDTPSGDTVMVVVDDVDGVDRAALIAAATPVVESLVFSP